MFDEVLRSPGQPLENQPRAYMENRFERDFSQVRIHTGAQASGSAKALNADAYTYGHNIVFNTGQYSPQSFEGRRLLAHELTHVVQQQAVAQEAALAPRPIYGSPNSSAEAEAENIGARVARGGQVVTRVPVSTPTVQRQPQSPPAGDQKGATDNSTERALTRPEERKISESSPGEIEIKAEPVLISLYNFPIDKATLKPEHRAVLKALALLLAGAKGANLELLLMGHTDSSGEPDVNNPISKRRALAVRNALPERSGIPLQSYWFGEDRPLVTNETVDGRSRNRRVDIYLVPLQAVDHKKKETKDPTKGDQEIDIIIYLKTGRKVRKTEIKKKKDEPEKKEPPKDDDDGGQKKDDGKKQNGGGGGWSIPNPCDGLLLGALCAAGGAWGAKKILCTAEPELCALYEWLKDDDGDGKKKPPEEKDEPKKEMERKACPISVELPSGVHRVPEPGSPSPLYLKWPFNMTLKFQQEAADHSPYCDCNCGEYRQEVKGWFEDNAYGGPVKRRPHHLRHGIYMDPDVFLEDGIATDPTHGYGHRYLTFIARLHSKDQARPMLAQNTDNDKFVDSGGHDDRENGCTYKGKDEPGVAAFSHPQAEYHFHLWFRGGPVDACNGDEEKGGWHEWEVIGDRVPPQSPPKPPQPKPSRTGTRSRPYSGPATGDQVSFVYAGGMSYAIKEATGSIKIQFLSQGEFHTSFIEIFITDVTDSTVLFETTNTSPVNVAPEDHRPLVIQPHTPGFIPKDKLRPPDP